MRRLILSLALIASCGPAAYAEAVTDNSNTSFPGDGATGFESGASTTAGDFVSTHRNGHNSVGVGSEGFSEGTSAPGQSTHENNHDSDVGATTTGTNRNGSHEGGSISRGESGSDTGQANKN